MKVQLIEEKRNDPVAWAGMAQELEQKGDLIDAEHAYRKAFQLKPDYKPAWLGLGKILEKTGKGTDAKAAFRRADELNNDSQK
jgi:cytochrome c-type biogenesis protein CcmH/NrfG